MLLKLISSFFKISVQTICLFLIFWAETTRKHFGRDIVFVIGIKPFLLFSIENNFFFVCLFLFFPTFFLLFTTKKKRDLTTTAHCTRTPLSLLMTGWPLLVFNFSVTALWLDFFFLVWRGGWGGVRELLWDTSESSSRIVWYIFSSLLPSPFFFTQMTSLATPRIATYFTTRV